MIEPSKSKPFAAFCLALLLVAPASLAIESPEYEVFYRDGNVEYRRYQPYLVAETVMSKSMSYKKASNGGFMRLFRYITGNNSSQTKIEMTAPVQQLATSEEIAMTSPVQRAETSAGWRVAFMLPSEFTLENAPVPTDERIVIRSLPGKLMAVIRYSGRWTQRNYEKHSIELLESIEAAAVEPLGSAESAVYDAPYVLPFLRRNEVMVEVNSIPVSARSLTPDS